MKQYNVEYDVRPRRSQEVIKGMTMSVDAENKQDAIKEASSRLHHLGYETHRLVEVKEVK